MAFSMAVLRHSVMLKDLPLRNSLNFIIKIIRDRRLMEPQDSPYRIVDACNQIPETLAGENVEAIGHH